MEVDMRTDDHPTGDRPRRPLPGSARPALAVLFAATLFICAPAAADVFTVDPAGGVLTTIQAGLDAASEGDTVRVVRGTYAGEGNRDLDFATENIVLTSVQGPSQTIVDAGGAGHRGIHFDGTGQDSTCVVDGFTIRGGDVSGAGGGGVLIDGANPKLVNCFFESNAAGAGDGGAILLMGSADPVIRHCHFIQNEARRGGAVYLSSGCVPRISGCLFQGNFAAEEGGALFYGFSPASGSLWGSVFVENESGDNGGAITCDQGSPMITGCTFIRNTAATGGGALHLVNQANAPVTRCTFVGNAAQLQGGCIKAAGGTMFVYLTQCIFAFTGPCDDRTIHTDGSSTATLNWCCSFGNAPGDNLPVSPDDYVIADPLFCDVTVDDLTLAEDSPCMPGGNEWGLLIGAHGEGCPESPVVERSWGAIKALYRGDGRGRSR